MFQLSLPLTTTILDITKLALTRALPEVKSSHRCEAMARGFGYRTYASLLEQARSNSIATIDDAALRAYLLQHDFNVPGSAFCRAGAKAALHAVAERFPSLTDIGFGIGDLNSKQTPAERR